MGAAQSGKKFEAGELARAQDVIARCRRLAVHSEEPGHTTRTFLCEPMKAVHRDVREWMDRAGMSVWIDAAGNIRGVSPRLKAGSAPGSNDDAVRLVVGSHLDTVPHAGAFDGILGVVLGIALVEQLANRPVKYAIEVVGFSEEEGVRFGVPFLGSRALTGELDADLLARRDAAGISVAEAIRAYGLEPDALPEAKLSGRATGFLEIHIEQGPVLESLNLPLGIVESIVGQSRLEITFEGAANHAGTTPMHLRRDALAGAAEWIAAVEREALSTNGLVATVGKIEATPGAGNVIAGAARASLDVRHPDDRVRKQAADRLLACANHIASRRGLTARFETRLDQPAVAMDARFTEMLERAVGRAGFPVHRMNSGAGHDAMVMGRALPSAMLFLRSPEGLSHHAEESVMVEDVAAALRAGARFLDEWENGHG